MKKENAIKMLSLLLILAVGVFIGCPIYQIFGIPCPCCGVTRAWIAFLKGEIYEAFLYNPLFIPIAGILIAFVFEERLFSKQKIKNIFFALSGAMLFLSYLVRLGHGMFAV